MRIVLAEDSTLLRAGLVELLKAEGHEVVAAEASADPVLAVVGQDPPDLVIMDVRMPPTFTDEGIRAAITLRRRHPGMAVLILSQHVERRYAAELLADSDGGVGYLLKDSVLRIDDFLDAIQRVSDGATVLDPTVVRHLLGRRDNPLGTLSERELEVLRLMAEGYTNAAIAGRLYLSRSAIEKHVQAVFAKLGLPESDGLNRRVLAILRYLTDGPARPSD